jgi:hypothetical protein
MWLKPWWSFCDSRTNTRNYLAVKALGLVGPDAKKAIHLIHNELENGHTKVKEVAREALVKINKERRTNRGQMDSIEDVF